ncbi:MAG: hypothetical protein ACREQ9_02875, partial [Candidatus Binatia bacterium]
VWVLTLNPDATVNRHQKISDWYGDFTGELGDLDEFGSSAANLGDLDGDGVNDAAVGAPGSPGTGDRGPGATWLLFLNPDGTVRYHQKISDPSDGLAGELDNLDHFGASVASLGDLDGDGFRDLAVGAPGDDDGHPNHGAVWILFGQRPLDLVTTITVQAPVLVPAEGGTIDAIVETHNLEQQFLKLEVWGAVADPAFGIAPPFQPIPVDLKPGERRSFPVKIEVPAEAPPGDYEVFVYVGTSPEAAHASDRFVFTKRKP